MTGLKDCSGIVSGLGYWVFSTKRLPDRRPDRLALRIGTIASGLSSGLRSSLGTGLSCEVRSCSLDCRFLRRVSKFVSVGGFTVPVCSCVSCFGMGALLSCIEFAFEIASYRGPKLNISSFLGVDTCSGTAGCGVAFATGV